MDAMIGDKKAPFAYAARKHGELYEAPEFLRNVLIETHGIMVFQEDIMRLSRVLSGFTASDANRLRKATGKKQPELMASLRNKFIQGARPKIDAGEITEEEVIKIWEQIDTFKNYAFCRAHATVYGAVSCVELWLKFHYPTQFVTALLNNTKLGKKKHGSENMLADYISYARRQGIQVLGPDINQSGEEFSINDGAIRFGLGRVKNVAKAARIIESFRPFTGMEDFYNRVRVFEDEKTDDSEPEEADDSVKTDEVANVSEKENGAKDEEMEEKSARRINKKVVESLIASGAFDCFGSRNEMAMAYWRLRRKSTKKDRLALKLVVAEDKLKAAVVDQQVRVQVSGTEKEIKKAGKAVAKAEEAVAKAKQAIIDEEKVEAAIAALPADKRPKKSQNDMPPEDLTDDKWQEAEAEVLGMCLSKPILYKQFEDTIRKEGWCLVSEIDPAKKKVVVFGEVISIDQHLSKAGNSMHIAQVSDGIDVIKFFVFQGGWESFKDSFKVGAVGAIPLAKFDEGDGGTRFFDDRGKCVILKKG
jgi:DNA polymerase III alpha subunit